MKVAPIPGATEIDPNTLSGLIPNLTTQAELNEFEAANIVAAMIWARKSRKLRKDLLSVTGLLSLHKKMFGDVWKWAGSFRLRDTSVGIDPKQIQPELKNLLDTVKYWMEKKTFSMEEIAIRFHHQLVRIHPFPNGNGRLSRLATDLFLEYGGLERFTWGKSDLVGDPEIRKEYILALRKADKNFDDIADLMKFAKS
jgi:Fic-DOC domain mobile mystery protein B